MSTIRLRSIQPDDTGAVCDLHAVSFAVLAGPGVTSDQIDWHTAMVRSPTYAVELLNNDVQVAIDVDGRILASAGWCPIDEPATARIRKVFVTPETAGRGLGRRLVDAVEAAARNRGHKRFLVRSYGNAAGFYERLGYRAVEAGTMAIGRGQTIPVVFMRKPWPEEGGG